MTDTTVELSEETYGLLAKRAKDKGFKTTDEYINYVLDQVAEKARKKVETDDQEFSEEDEEKVKKRLKSLGYLD
ncbi:MAG: CopG family transcriptional regulator [Nanohaloarchaea archaeon SW_7_43_1]|nr:MAG: CopG family transcriptional regulator [Nanohaloarchaea archaeon SW_7_43_1]